VPNGKSVWHQPIYYYRQPHRIPNDVRWFIISQKTINTPPTQIISKVFAQFQRRITFETISRVWSKYINGGSRRPQRRVGRPRTFSEREERNLVRDFLTTPGLSIKQVVRERQAANKPGCRKTIRHILRSRGLVPKVSNRGKEITKKNKGKRINFANLYQNWEVRDWGRVVFSDEATIFPQRTKTCVRWSRPGEANPPPLENNLKIKSINVWGYIDYNGNGEIFRFNGTMKKESYLEMLEEHLFEALDDPNDPDDEFIFVQDKASYHNSPDVINWLRRNNVNFIDLPPQSPDLNLIENVWASVRNELFDRRTRIRNSNDVWAETRDIFHNLTLVYIRKLYESMPRRLESIIKLKGNRTSY